MTRADCARLLSSEMERLRAEAAQLQAERNEAYGKFHRAEERIVELEAEVARLRAPDEVVEGDTEWVDAEGVQHPLTALPGASAMERIRPIMKDGCHLKVCRFPICIGKSGICNGRGETALRAIEQAEREARAAGRIEGERISTGERQAIARIARKQATKEARAILHEEGWLGRTEQRIVALAQPTDIQPKVYAAPRENAILAPLSDAT